MQVPAAIAPIVNLVFPPRCPLCGEGLSEQQGLCTACWSELAIPGAPCCSLCQRPFPDGMPDGTVCAPCLADPPKHDGIAAGTLYNDASRRLVLAFKHGHRIALAPLLARLMIPRLGDIGPDWIVVPGGNLGNSSAFGKAFSELHQLGLIDRIAHLLTIHFGDDVETGHVSQRTEADSLTLR